LSAYLSDMKKALSPLRFLVPVLFIFFVLLRSMFQNHVFSVSIKMDWLTMLTYPSAVSGFTPFAAIFPLIPYAASFIDDLQSGYVKGIVTRTGIRKYSKMRILSAAFSGGLTIFLPYLFIFAVIVINGVPTTPANINDIFLSLIWAPFVTVGGGLLVMAAKLLLAFLFGSVWALVGLFLSTIVCNRYVTMIAPFVLYQALWLFLPGNMNPVVMLRGDLAATNHFIGSYWFLVLVQSAIIAVLSIGSLLGIRRKVLHG